MLALLFMLGCLHAIPGAAQIIKVETSLKRLPLERMESLPKALFGMGYATNGTHLYSWGGANTEGQFSNNVYQYNPQNNQWKSTEISGEMSLRRYGSLVYEPSTRSLLALGGDCLTQDYEAVACPTMERLSLDSGTISQVTNPFIGRKQGVAVLDDAIAVIGGYDSGRRKYSNDVHWFIPATGEWFGEKNIPIAMETTAAVMDNTLFIMGGFTEGKVSMDAIYAMPIGSKSWKMVVNLPNPLSANAVATSASHIFIVGNYHDESFFAVLEPSKRRMRIFKDQRLRRHSAAVVLGDHLYIWGGARVRNHYFEASDRLFRIPLSWFDEA